jgi:AcrR family transcriptional regulator
VPSLNSKPLPDDNPMVVMMQTQRLSRQAQRETGRAKLMKAALGVFSRKGFQDTSVEDICLAAGYSKGGFYFHFRGKDDLLLRLVEEAGERTALPSGGSTPALTMELWSQVARKEELRRLLSERYASRRRELETAAAFAGISPGGAAATVVLLLALEAGLQIQEEFAPAPLDVLPAKSLVGDLLAALAPDMAIAADGRHRRGRRG